MGFLDNVKAFGMATKDKAVAHAPELLLAGGFISGGCALIFTAMGTIKAMDDLEDGKELISEMKEKKEELGPTYGKYLTKAYLNTGIDVGKHYIPAAGFASVSVICLCASYGIMKKRYVAVVSAYTALEEAFRVYRERVIEDRGKDADTYYMTGVKPKEITVKDEEGNKEKKKILPVLPDGTIASPYAFKFSKYKENGQLNRQWENSAFLNQSYLLGQQDYFNDQLYLRCLFDHNHRVKKRGVVMLDEIREVCDLDHSSTGSVCGWRFSNGEPGCNGYIDLGLIEGREIDPDTGEEIPYFWVNPNVDGMIFDKLDEFEKVPFEPKGYIDRMEDDINE